MTTKPIKVPGPEHPVTRKDVDMSLLQRTEHATN